jgi:phosphopantetheine adenylyltransferase
MPGDRIKGRDHARCELFRDAAKEVQVRGADKLTVLLGDAVKGTVPQARHLVRGVRSAADRRR